MHRNSIGLGCHFERLLSRLVSLLAGASSSTSSPEDSLIHSDHNKSKVMISQMMNVVRAKSFH